jgi:hypothetical protein
MVRFGAARQGKRNVPDRMERNHYMTLMPSSLAWANLDAGWEADRKHLAACAPKAVVQLPTD